MHTLRLWTLCLLLTLLTPLAWSRAPQTAPTPLAHAAQMVMPCHGGAHAVMVTDRGATAHGMAGKHQPQAGCGDCSACHVLALLPADWRLHGPSLIEATPGWHATPGGGRLKVCELYRPPPA